MKNLRLLSLGALASTLACGAIFFTSNGCSSDDDTAPGTTTPDASPDGTTSSGNDSSPPDTADCAHCIDSISAACRTRQFCTHNDTGGGKSSVDLIFAQQKCTCTDECATECAQVCTGQGDVPPECNACIAQKCTSFLTACLADRDPVDPSCNDPFGQADAGQPDASDAGADADAQ